MRVKLVTPPTDLPVSVPEAKRHLHLVGDEQNVSVALYLRAAVKAVEGFTGRQCVKATYTLYLDAIPTVSEIVIPRPPFIALSTPFFQYIDDTGSLVTWADTNWDEDATGDEYGRVYPVFGGSWPSARIVFNAVQLTFDAGYGEAEDVPEDLKAAILLVFADLFEHRERNLDQAVAANPTAEALLWSFRALRLV